MPLPTQTFAQYSDTSTPVKEAETVRFLPLPRITGLDEWCQTLRENFGTASGRPAQACKYLCIAEDPTMTYDDLSDSGDFESIDCKLAAALKNILTNDLRQIIKNFSSRSTQQNA